MCVKCSLFKVTFTRRRGMLGFDPPTCEPHRESGMSLVELQEMPTVQPSAWWVSDPQTYSLRVGEVPRRCSACAHLFVPFANQSVPSTSCLSGGVYQVFVKDGI